jgi:uncharacterized protein YxeA
MLIVIIVVVIILLVIIYNYPKHKCANNDSDNPLIDQVKNGNTELNTEEPMLDYIRWRQIYNTTGDLRNKDM